jgi:hypothetical protein
VSFFINRKQVADQAMTENLQNTETTFYTLKLDDEQPRPIVTLNPAYEIEGIAKHLLGCLVSLSSRT